MYYMPAHSISINTPTNAKIRQIVQNLEQSYTPEPERFVYGGGAVREYAQSGNNGSYPAPQEGGNLKKTARKQSQKVIEAIADKAVDQLGGGPSKKMRKVGKAMKQGAHAFNQVMGPVASMASTLAPLAPLLLALGEGDMETKPVKPKRI